MISASFRDDGGHFCPRYGFNGVVIPTPDLPSLAAHLRDGFKRRPPDHLLFEWFSGERPETKARALGRSYASRSRSTLLTSARCADGGGPLFAQVPHLPT
jgi:hypothetical protein